jgi:hypothetical protein
LRCEELRERCEAFCVLCDDPRARELSFARAEVFLARVEPLDDDFRPREPFDEERPRLVARVAFPCSLVPAIFNLPDSGLPAWQA